MVQQRLEYIDIAKGIDIFMPLLNFTMITLALCTWLISDYFVSTAI